MHTRKTIASVLIVGLALINWLPIEEVAKVTRLLPYNFFSNRSEIQFIDQEIRQAVRRYARSEERNGANAQYSDDGTQASIVKNSSLTRSLDAVSARVRIQNYLSKASN